MGQANIAISLFFLAVTVCADPYGVVDIHVDSSDAIFETFSEYLSVDLDWWTGENGRVAWENCGLLSLDLSNVRLKNLAKELGGGYLRLGGSLDVSVKYLYSKKVEQWCKTPAINHEKNWSLCLNFSRWDEINKFAAESNLKLVFGISYPGANTIKNGTVPPLNITQNSALLQYSVSKGYDLAAIELGEEIAPADPESFKNFVDAYKMMKNEIVNLWPDASSRPKLLGPCLGMSDAVGKGECEGNTTCTVTELVKNFLEATVQNSQPTNVIDGYCLHGYNDDGGDHWKHAGFNSEILHQAVALKSELGKYDNAIPLWVGESGPHNHGGIENVTDRFISSLWYVDALGSFASVGVSEFGRQALVGSYYALLDVTNNFSPNPDYFTAVTWRRLMGSKVLNIDVKHGGNTEGDQEVFHAYAHCGVAKGKVGVVFVNIDTEKSFHLYLTNVNAVVDFYHFTAADDALYSKVMNLNGKPLLLNGDKVPPITPTQVDLKNGKFVVATPSSFGFLIYACDKEEKCVCSDKN